MKSSEQWIKTIFNPETHSSLWLKQGLDSALKRDPAEASADAETLALVLRLRWEEIQKGGVK